MWLGPERGVGAHGKDVQGRGELVSIPRKSEDARALLTGVVRLETLWRSLWKRWICSPKMR